MFKGIFSVCRRPLELTGWCEAQFEGEDWCSFGSGLISPCHVREAYRLDELSLSVEFHLQRFERDTLGCWNVVRPVVGEEIPVILAVNAELCNQVGKVCAISQELEAKARGNVCATRTVRLGSGVTNKPIGCSPEDSSEWRLHCIESDLRNDTNRVDHFVAASIRVAWQIITWAIKSWRHTFD